MFKTIKEYALPVLVTLCALAVSGSAAFYSVTGLSKLFAGASLEVMVMAATLEISKLVIAAMLHRFWGRLNGLLKTYLTSAAVILVLITSMGIYGFLSAAYQQTAASAGIVDKEVEFLQQREQFFQEDVDRYDIELERISANISELSKAKTQQLQVRDESVEGGVRTTISTAELRLAQSRIAEEEANRNRIIPLRTQAADSLRAIQTRVLEAEANSEVAAELGPLKFIAGLTGISMDRIVNYLLLVIIFVFDPLAISLVIAASSMFEIVGKKRKEEEETDWTFLEADPNDLPDLGDIEVIVNSSPKKEEEPEVYKPKEEEEKVEEKKGVKKEPEKKPRKPRKKAEPKKEVEIDIPLQNLKIVKVLQRTPSKVHVLKTDGKRHIMSKNQYEKEIASQ
jgi:hypothetical protein